MADRPILFSAPMVRALLSGTKTQTRRLARPASPIRSCRRRPRAYREIRRPATVIAVTITSAPEKQDSK